MHPNMPVRRELLIVIFSRRPRGISFEQLPISLVLTPQWLQKPLRVRQIARRRSPVGIRHLTHSRKVIPLRKPPFSSDPVCSPTSREQTGINVPSARVDKRNAPDLRLPIPPPGLYVVPHPRNEPT